MDDKDTKIVETENVDQTVLAEDISNRIHYEFTKEFLVKPLDPVMVKKEFSKPVEKTEAKKDANDIEAIDYDEVETEVKEVESDFMRGIVLKIPHEYSSRMEGDFAPMDIKIGNIVIFPVNQKRYFDLCKDTVLVNSYSIVGVEK